MLIKENLNGCKSSPNRPATILICDDQPANIELLNVALSRDYRLKVATSGAVALQIAGQDEKPDLILLDIIMPEMDGYEVCRRLKRDPATAMIPVIFISALDKDEDETLGLELGAADYLIKPFNNTIVRLRVNNILTMTQQRDLLQKQKEELEKSLAQVKLLSGMLPICAACKKIRDDQGYWKQLETYFEDHAEVEFTHGICPDCMEKLYPEYADSQEDDD